MVLFVKFISVVAPRLKNKGQVEIENFKLIFAWSSEDIADKTLR